MAIYKTLKLSSLYPHPVITQSVNDSLNVYGNDSFNELSDAMLEVLQQAHPVHVVPAGSDKTYHFFAGWQLFHELRRRGRSNVYAVIHTTPPPNLEEWAGLLVTLSGIRPHAGASYGASTDKERQHAQRRYSAAGDWHSATLAAG